MPKWSLVLLLLCLSSVTFATAFNSFQIENLKKSITVPVANNVYTTTSEGCGSECQRIIKEEVAKEIAKSTPITTVHSSPLPKKPASTELQKQTTYIPISGPVSTTSTDWTDVPGSDFSVDLLADYGKNAFVSWEASIKIANAAGNVLVRLYDTTNKIAVNGSEISSGSASYTTISSSHLPFWAGRNTYKVQIKSQSSQEATFGSGRVKVVY